MLSLCKEHDRLSSVSSGEQSTGLVLSNVPLGKRFCMKPKKNINICKKKFEEGRTFETIAGHVRIPDIAIELKAGSYFTVYIYIFEMYLPKTEGLKYE